MKNQLTNGISLSGTGASGDSKPDVNMPANNVTNYPVKLGAGQTSKFGAGTGMGKAQKAATQLSGSPKVNLQATNTFAKKAALGTTMHGVGKVPGYLRNTY